MCFVWEPVLFTRKTTSKIESRCERIGTERDGECHHLMILLITTQSQFNLGILFLCNARNLKLAIMRVFIVAEMSRGLHYLRRDVWLHSLWFDFKESCATRTDDAPEPGSADVRRNNRFLFCSRRYSDSKSNQFRLFARFSTREIKPNQTDIGRKVKVKTIHHRFSNIPNNTLNKRDSTTSSSSSSSFVNSSSNNSLNNSVNNNQTHNPNSNSSATASPLKNNNFNVHQYHNSNHHTNNSSSSGCSISNTTTTTNNHNHNTNNHQQSFNANSNSNTNANQLQQFLHGSSMNNLNSNANNQIIGHGVSGINNVVPNRAANSRNIPNCCARGNPDIKKRPIKWVFASFLWHFLFPFRGSARAEEIDESKPIICRVRCIISITITILILLNPTFTRAERSHNWKSTERNCASANGVRKKGNRGRGLMESFLPSENRRTTRPK